ncbi:HIT family protein [Alkalicaulis satelles]|uniref:HIT family protein n=1 Tax=Alkalicaulis satelles TaxID=2609175 RepID=A0A5M6ZJK9_9PROT|nr:HIT family protein [Alkalicaulis satelles]KAA5804996.1 HIT family protein [Alkalicaulis satelles]
MSLHGSYDDENIFAKILRGEAQAARVYEDEHVLAIMDLFPQSEGHMLVIPKARARNLLDLPADAAARAIERVQTLTRAVEAVLKPDGVMVAQFNGAPAGQTVFHIHFHIIPRWADRNIAGHGQAGQADPDALKALAARIAAAIEA